MKHALYLDDVRPAPEPWEGYSPWVVVRSYEAFVSYITEQGIPDLISFDHDLAREHYTLENNEDFITLEQYYARKDRKMTGYDCAYWLVYTYLPVNPNQTLKDCVVHSLNPDGARNICYEINGYKIRKGLVPDCHIVPARFNSFTIPLV